MIYDSIFDILKIEDFERFAKNAISKNIYMTSFPQHKTKVAVYHWHKMESLVCH
jgi:hypothetical protein